MAFQKSDISKELIFGTRPILESIKAGKELESVMINRTLNSEIITEIMTLCEEREIPVQRVPAEKLDRLTGKAHQGVIGFLSAITYGSLSNIIADAYEQGKTPLILVLDRITDVRNFGAIVRTAECSGVNAIVVPDKGKARIGSDAFKTSAGALSFMPICREKSLKNALLFLRDSGLQIVACTEKASNVIYDVNYDVPTAILMGSEEDGISDDFLRLADQLVKIPLLGKIESLNVSVATGVILFELMRQRYTE